MMASLVALFQTSTKLALVGGMLLDGYEVPPVHHAVVLVEGDRIVKVGRVSDTPIPPGYEVIDTRGRTMLPGLIDLHAHLTILGHGDYGRYFTWLAEESDLSLEDIMEISAKQLLEAGVTSAVDLGAPLEESVRVRDRIARGEIPGPRMSVSGAWVARRTFGGFPSEAQRLVSSPEEASQVVEELAKGGADVIKAWAGLTREDYDAIVATAHRHGIPVHAHLYDPESLRNALEAGVDVLQHVGSARRGRRPTSLSSYAPSSRAAVRSYRREPTASGSFPRRCSSRSGCKTVA